jgi:hypothetical protein
MKGIEDYEKLSTSGYLKQCHLSDIFLSLQRSEKTGILELKNGSLCKKVYIKNGNMIFAASNHEEDRLGEFLMKAEKITLDQYYQSIEGMKRKGKRQGTVLVELGYLKPKDLIWAITHQVEEIILSLFQWEDGEFEFKEGILPSEEVITLKLSTANLIYRGIKRINNVTYIKNACPPMNAILYYSAEPIDLFQDITLEEKDKGVLSLIDGSRKVLDIISLSPLSNLQTMKILYALMSTRIIEIKEEGKIIEDKIGEKILKEPEGEFDPAFVEKVETIYDRLSSTDYYTILGITKWNTSAEIKGAYYRKAKEFHPDKHFHLPSETLKNKLNAVFSYLTVAYKTLSDLKMRREYDIGLSSRSAPMESSNSEVARIKFMEGNAAFRRKSYAEAAELFRQAVNLKNSIAVYHFNLGLALVKDKKFREAQEAMNNALKLDPSNASYMAELGHIYLGLGFVLRAKAIFEKTIKFDPTNERAVEGLALIKT